MEQGEGTERERQENTQKRQASNSEVLAEVRPTKDADNQAPEVSQADPPQTEVHSSPSAPPIWMREEKIYGHGFTTSFFWLSQVLALGTAILFYITEIARTEEENLFLNIAYSIGGWTCMIVIWFLGGMFSSRLFMVNSLD